jgi:hypothetical protein
VIITTMGIKEKKKKKTLKGDEEKSAKVGKYLL